MSSSHSKKLNLHFSSGTPNVPRLISRSWFVLAPAILLSACVSTPLPPWPKNDPNTLATQPQTQASGELKVQPLDISATQFGVEVLRRFPPPSITYFTPGLEKKRDTFTSNDELRQWLYGLTTSAPAMPRVKTTVRTIGISQQGTGIDAILFSTSPDNSPSSFLKSDRPTILFVGQQHGNEPAPGESLLVLSNELVLGQLTPLLKKVNVIVVPRANPDGTTAGIRATANGLDMNRDHLLLNTPEAQALAQLIRDYRPIVIVDSHEYTVAGKFLQKYNALQGYDALTQYATTANLPEFLTRAAEEWFRQPLKNAFSNQGLSHEWYYTTSNDLKDPSISMGGVLPDTGRNVNGLKNTVSILMETRGIGLGRQHIQRRVHTQFTAFSSILYSAAHRADDLVQLRKFVDAEVSNQACFGDIIIESAPTPAQYEITMIDPKTGKDRVMSVDWNSALSLKTTKSRSRPCGYWLDATATTAVERLRLLGVQVMQLQANGASLGETYQEITRNSTDRQDVRGTLSGNKIVKSDVVLARSLLDLPKDSYYIPLNQPLANLVVAALEPDTQSSYYANNIVPNLLHQARIVASPIDLKMKPVN